MIQNETERAAAQKQAETMLSFSRGRSMTDDQTREFDALMSEIDAYDSKHPVAATTATAATRARHEAPGATMSGVELVRASMLKQLAAANPGSEIAATLRQQSMAGDGSTAQSSMRREIERRGLAPPAAR